MFREHPERKISEVVGDGVRTHARRSAAFSSTGVESGWRTSAID